MKINRMIYRTLLIAIVAILGFTTCKNEDDPFVLRSTDEMSFSYLASSQTFTVRANGAWSVNNDGNEWINISPASGTGNGETYEYVTVHADRNTGLARTGRITINAAGKEIYINVSQEEGLLIFGEPSLSGSIPEKETFQDVNLRIPYSRAVGDEQFTVSVQVSGEAAAAINNVVDYPVRLTDIDGVIYIPLSGTTADRGEITFTITTTYPGASVPSLDAKVGSALLHNADFIISGYLADPDGTDSPAIGAKSGGGFVHLGGYEYVQFLALKDINFVETPYCLVTCTNADQTTPGDKGWIAGKEENKKTYQININQGSVKKGEFFYVGGISRLLDSYPSSGTDSSPAVSPEKWPIAIDYYTVSGDNGNGQAVGSSGILGNWGGTAPNFTNVADGIAVFKGIYIDENSVPMDAIFYGTNVLTKLTFQIPTNDHYSRVNEAGMPQPYYGQGSNTWLASIIPPANDDGYYTALGGEVSTTEWITPRTPKYIQMKKSTTIGVYHTTDDIEVVAGCTKFVNK